MPHELTVTDKRGNVLHSRHIQQREDAFAAYDRAVQRANPDAAEITLVEDGHVNRRHVAAEVTPDAEADWQTNGTIYDNDGNKTWPSPVKATESGDRERAGDAPVDAGDAPAAGEAAPQDVAPTRDAKPQAADETERSKGRASNRPVTAAKDK